MDLSIEYKKICPYCGGEFTAEHLSQKYCSQECKKRMFRKKNQEKREYIAADHNALKSNDEKLRILFGQNKPDYKLSDLQEVHFDQTCYYRRYKIANNILTIIEDFVLLELPEGVFRIYQYF